jgi:glycosyltransferase involved in cell wall biosynthesis
MTASIDLLWLGAPANAPDWTHGRVCACEPDPAQLDAALRAYLGDTSAEYILCWDNSLDLPETGHLTELTSRPIDVWHAGLRLGMGGQPRLIDFVTPTWMLNRDPDPDIEATSWRMSWRACLIRTDVLRQMGGPNAAFATLDCAALEAGHRWITRGVLMRYSPGLVRAAYSARPIPFEDELRFVRLRFSKFWSAWALWRTVVSGYVSPLRAFRAWRIARKVQPSPRPTPYKQLRERDISVLPADSVTVLIPTVDRYPYLRTLLNQLRVQTVRPREIIIVDQTDPSRRDVMLADSFNDLPIRMINQESAGQCSSRNAGLQVAEGEHILFLDDDDEIEPTLIEQHLRNLRCFQASASCGTAHEMGAGPLPENFTFFRTSDVFPTNNTLLHREWLIRSGLFDLAYEHMPRADGDLGMRLYLSGAHLVYDPEINVLHHHAPRGGLRIHKARVITYASSRQSLFQRQLPAVSEIYLAMRYFTPRQVREALWMRALGTLSGRRGLGRRLLKVAIMTALLPHTVVRIVRSYGAARAMLSTYPQIPQLSVQLPVEETV